VDRAGALAAIRHSRCHCVTASVDSLHFHHPVHIGELVVLRASVNRVFRSSMEVGVRVVTEDMLKGTQRHTVSAYLTFVALNDEGMPTPVEPVIPETAEETRRYQQAEERRQYRLAKRPRLKD